MTVPTRVVSALPTGTAFSRYLQVLGVAGGDTYAALALAEKFKDSPTVYATLALQGKAAVSAGSTTDADWAGPLAQYGIAAEALALLRGASILGQLESKMRRIPFRTKVSRQTGAGTGGAWIGEGLSTPVAATAYDMLSQGAFKAGKIVVLSKELLKIGDPIAERTVRETVAAGVAAYLDAQFLTPTVTLSAGLRPAAITNGATEVTSTGTTTAQITADLAGLLAAVTSSGALTWIMRQGTMARIALALGSQAPDLPRTLFGIPVLVSAGSCQQVTLVDAAQILYSDDGAIDLSISEQAALEMDSAPSGSGGSPMVESTLVSLWQTDSWGVRVIRWLAYLRAQSDSVAYMTTAY